jgi:hypothetical protein
MGKQLKQSVKVFHNLMLYRRLPIVVSSCTEAQPFGRLTLIIEPVDPVDTSTLVVTP